MKKLFFLIFFNTFVFSDIDWSDVNSCKLPDYSNFVDEIIDEMTLEQKVGQIIMPEINSITADEVKKFYIGTILNGGGGFPNQNKNSDIDDWKNLSKVYYEASPQVNGIKIPILWGTDAVHGHNNVIGATIFPHNIGLGATRNTNLLKKIGSAVAREVVSTGIIWTFAPTIAVPQNDLWGRTYEGYSENTNLVSDLGKSFIEGLMSTGCNVEDIGLCLSPTIYFSQFKLNTDAVAMVTASHNENGWTGIKMGIQKGITHCKEEMAELKEIVLKQKFNLGDGSTKEIKVSLKVSL